MPSEEIFSFEGWLNKKIELGDDSSFWVKHKIDNDERIIALGKKLWFILHKVRTSLLALHARKLWCGALRSSLAIKGLEVREVNITSYGVNTNSFVEGLKLDLDDVIWMVSKLKEVANDALEYDGNFKYNFQSFTSCANYAHDLIEDGSLLEKHVICTLAHPVFYNTTEYHRFIERIFEMYYRSEWEFGSKCEHLRWNIYLQNWYNEDFGQNITVRKVLCHDDSAHAVADHYKHPYAIIKSMWDVLNDRTPPSGGRIENLNTTLKLLLFYLVAIKVFPEVHHELVNGFRGCDDGEMCQWFSGTIFEVFKAIVEGGLVNPEST